MRGTRIIVAAMTVLGLSAHTAAAQERTINSQTGRIKVETLTDKLENPWSVAFLPDGRMLVTERPGRLRIVTRDGKVSAPLQGVPRVFASGQGGLHDVVLDPNFTSNRLVYLAYAEPGPGGASTAAARAQLGDNGITGLKVIFSQRPKVTGGRHFGGRLVFARDGTLFVSTGDRGAFDPAQDISSQIGKIVRINPDGSVPEDNPFVGRERARPEIWSYGNRNAQGAALHPQTGALWENEHGPRGGDEINIIEAGKNYGWPLVSWGNHYTGQSIAKPNTRPDLTDAIHQWTPVIGASGMAFYTADMFRGWRGNLLVGGLVSRGLVRLTLDGRKVTGEERIALGARVRDVRQGPDGAVYVLTDESDGKILRLSPG
jgi:glucose/arabinose dehydrogenase